MNLAPGKTTSGTNPKPKLDCMRHLAFHDMHLDQLPDPQRNPEPSTTPVSHLPTGGAQVQWDSNGQTVAVYFHLNLIDRLESEARRSGDTVRGGVAGVLLGRLDYGDTVTLVVEDYESVSRADSVPAMVNRWRNSPDKRMWALGAYRVSERQGSVLVDDDLAILANHLVDQERIFLLINARVGQPSIGTVFLARGGTALPQENSIRLPFSRMDIANTKPPLGSGSRAEAARVEGLCYKPSEPRAQGRRWRVLVLALGFSVAAAAVIQNARLFPGWTILERDSRDLVSAQASRLDLGAEQRGNGWQLTWNSYAPSVMTATRARLFITDGPLEKEVEVAPADLRSGKIFYVPATDSVVLRLEIIDQRGEAKTESVRILGGLSPLISSSILDAGTSSDTLPSRRAGLRTSRAGRRKLEAPIVDANSEAFPMTSTEGPEAAIAMQHDDKGNSMPEKELLALTSSGLPTIPSAIKNLSAAMAKPRAIEPQPSSKTSPAQLILRIDPIYPKTARNIQLQGKVIAKAVVENDGRVRNIRIVSGPLMLAQAAVAAMREWRYNPAILNGEPVQSEAEARFDFKIPNHD